MIRAVFLLTVAVSCLCPRTQADSVVVFNEIMYHPAGDESVSEWVEIHNQLVVDVDLSHWAIRGGIDYEFPSGSVIPGRGYLLIAIHPETVGAALGLTNVFGPFQARLSNSGERLELRNNNQRLMDSVRYGDDDDWPVGPDGAGVSLAKRHPDLKSADANSWVMSAQIGGTPGQPNFPRDMQVPAQLSLIQVGSSWKYHEEGTVPADWNQPNHDDSRWPSGPALLHTGSPDVRAGKNEPVATLFSTGLDNSGAPIAPGDNDPHFLLVQSAVSTPSPPAAPATVISHHPAWLSNDETSAWLGPRNPGTSDVPAGSYVYRTAFDLSDYNHTTAQIRLAVSVDNELLDVLLNGRSLGMRYAGFANWSPEVVLTNFVSGLNTLEFRTLNAGSTPNPAGFRARLNGTAFRPVPLRTEIRPSSVTHYLRSTFTFDPNPAEAELELQLILSDGAVVYLNGKEIARWNMPPGPLTSATYALTNVSKPEFTSPISLPTSHLIPGTNVFAVEVHRAENNLSGLVFGAELTATVHPGKRPALAFNEISAATDSPFFVELVNNGTNTVSLEGFQIAGTGAAEVGFRFPNGPTLAPGEYLALSDSQLGFKPRSGNKLHLYSPSGRAVLDSVVVKTRLRGRFPEATGPWRYPSGATFGAPNQFEFRDEVVINEIMYHPPPHPGQSAEYQEQLLLPIDATWRYHQQGIDLGTAWREPNYNDDAWPSGAGLFYVEEAALPAPKKTPLTLGKMTYYFRTSFVFSGSAEGLLLQLRPIVDDAAVFYLNGMEVYRSNMPDGPVSYNTAAASGIGDATFSGLQTIPTDRLVIGTNVLAVEVHQQALNSSDLVFGTELLARVQTKPKRPFQESDQQWIELYNRSANSVDLTGWKLENGVEFTFPDNLMMPPGSYLVIARNQERLQTQYPDIAVVGNYTGRLSRRSDLLVLTDSFGNPASQVRYFDDGQWPSAADGGGSSLELRNPFTDIEAPQSWAASDETGRSEWKSYTYRAVANQSIDPTLWHEFVFGLLGAGEVLLDDLSVVENPSGTRRELLQNGSFQSGSFSWRFLGNHRHSKVIIDPENPNNRLLHLIATGSTEHMHNHVETTLANNATIANGRDYEISFKAKWLTGSRQLNTRLYFNRAARTTLLDAPLWTGTPGQENSRREPNLGPTFSHLQHHPLVPDPNQNVRISVHARDPEGVQSCTLWWAAHGRFWTSIPMARNQGKTFTANIPGQSSGSIVQFYVEAVDARGARSTFPARGRNSRALFVVNNGQGTSGQLHTLRLIMTPSDSDWMHAATNVMSNERLGATVIYNGRDVWYDLGVRLKSSQRGRLGDARVGFSVRFPPDRLFRGAHETISIDRSGGYSGRGGPQDEILLKHMINRAGGMAGMYDDLVWFVAPRNVHTGTAQLLMAEYGDVFLDSQFASGSDGPLFKYELIYYPLRTVDGNPESPKLPQPDEVIGTDIQDLGNDKEQYRWFYLIRNEKTRDDYSLMINLAKTFSLSGPALEQRTRELMDIDQWMRTFAMKSLSGDADTYSTGLPHNFKIYFRPEDQKALPFLWDMDFAWYRSTTAPVVVGANISKIISFPANLRLYYGHLQDIIQTSFNRAYMAPWAAHYGTLTRQNYSGILDYITQRGNYVLSQISPHVVPFAITSNRGRDFMVNSASARIQGVAGIDLKTLAVEGMPLPLEWKWTGTTNWQVTIPLVLGKNPLVFVGYDFQGQPVSRHQITITSTALSGHLDADQDGLPDAWELQNGLDPSFPDDALADPDADRSTNLQEYFAGTNPMDRESRLILEQITASSGALSFSFLARAGRSYTIETSQTLNGPWTSLTHVDAQLEDRAIQVSEPASFEALHFYRLVTPRRPE